METNNRKYVIFNTSEIGLIDFSQTVEDGSEFLRYSVDGTKTFIKWETDIVPEFINNLTTKEGPFDIIEISSILNSKDWNSYHLNNE